jgi:excinuclease ABC subunit B
MYADTVTDSMRRAMDETQRRRDIQTEYNRQHGITPQSIKKAIKGITDQLKMVAEQREQYTVDVDIPKDEIARLIKSLESQMKTAAKNLEYEKAALLRDQIVELRKALV